MIQEALRIWAKERDPIAWRVLADLVEEQVGHERRDEELENLLRSVNRGIERAQLEEVVREQGNLETKPWRVRMLSQEEPYQWARAAGARLSPELENPFVIRVGDRVISTWPGREFNIWLWIDFAPEYLQRDLERASEDTGTFRTVYSTGGGYQTPQEEYLLDVKTQEVWRRVADGAHGAETECPFRSWDMLENTDQRDGIVRVEETWFGEHPNKECLYCDEKIGEPHGHVYVGEGSETVYEMLAGEDEVD